MKTPALPGAARPFRAAVCLLSAAAAAGSARSQAMTDEPYAPAFAWMPEGAATVVAVREGEDMPPPEAHPWTPSVGEFSAVDASAARLVVITLGRAWPESRDARRVGASADGSVRDTERPAGRWRETLLMIFAPPGTVGITSRREPFGPPLILDRFTVTPSPVDFQDGSLDSALTAPGLSFLSARRGWVGFDWTLEGDDPDAVWLRGAGRVSVRVPGGLVVSRGEHIRNLYTFRGFADGRVINPRTQFLTGPEGMEIRLTGADPDLRPLRRLSIAPPVSLAEALDAEGLTVEIPPDSGSLYPAFGSTDAPPGAGNGDAVALPRAVEDREDPRLLVSGFTGPGVLRYSWWDGPSLGISEWVNGVFPEHGFSRARESGWRTESIPIPAGVTSHVLQREGWVDDLSFVPAPR